MLIFKCSKCGKENAPGENDANSLFFTCSCGSRSHSEIFPVIKEEFQKGERPEMALNEEARCFVHDQNIAVAACEYCGVYMCKLCDLEIENKHVCPNCLKEKSEGFKTTAKSTFLYDELALHLATLPLLVYIFLIVTAPIAVGISIFCRNKVHTPYKRSRWRFVAAFIIGSIEIAVFALIIYSSVKN